ncbi:Protein RTF2 [Blattella germanica]|nr:Protein RTF2 [Blattella germanica]
MGCDGGTIPKRDELVRKKKKPEQKDKDSELSFRWKHCSITQQPLQSPIVACSHGRLYSKDAVIEGLLDKTNLPETSQHIKNLKDIRDLNLTPNPSYKPSAEKGDAYVDRQTAAYICPVIGLEMNGKFRFIFLWKCGCVMSERALKECQQPFAEEDIVVLNGTQEDLELMKSRSEARQARLKAEKKAKRKGNSSATAGGNASTDGDKKMETSEDGGDAQNEKQEQKPPPKLIGAKRPRGNDIEDPMFKKTKGSYSVANDPKASDVFKSLFTSHQKARQQDKAHWITYNPFYN